jgi:hypothetical protein
MDAGNGAPEKPAPQELSLSKCVAIAPICF